MPRHPKVEIKRLASGSWSIDTTALGPRYRKTWPNEGEALRDAERIRRQVAGTGLDAGKLRAYEATDHLLATVECAGKGKDILFAVQWFLSHYKDAGQQALSWYANDYKLRKESKLEKKSMVEVRIYLDAFCAEFGSMLPGDISAHAIEGYLQNNTSRYYRDKVLRAFFGWLTGVVPKRARIAKLEHPPLERNPFDFVERTSYEKQRPTEILSYDEVIAVLGAASLHSHEVLAWFVWLLFTGMRPEAEARPFWTLAGHGWDQVHLGDGVICVTDELEKTGARTRDIAIQPNLRAWIEWFKAHDVRPVYSRRAIRDVFDSTVPDRNHQDLLRHTFISFLLKIEKESEVCYQGATSPGIVKKHYRRHVPADQVAKFWAITPAALGLL